MAWSVTLICCSIRVTEQKQTLTLNGQSGQNIAVNLDVSDPNTARELGVGYKGNGSLTIRDGITVNSNSGWIGYDGSTGIATVDGPGSTWNTGALEIGNWGTGTLNITHGATVNSSNADIGFGVNSKRRGDGQWRRFKVECVQ